MDYSLRQRTAHILLQQFEQRRYLPHTLTEHLWDLLCAAHIAGQSIFALHIQSHLCMLSLALQKRNGREALGQIMRLALVPIGHLFGKLPMGNSGRANVNAFKEMPVQKHWHDLIVQAQQSTTA